MATTKCIISLSIIIAACFVGTFADFTGNASPVIDVLSSDNHIQYNIKRELVQSIRQRLAKMRTRFANAISQIPKLASVDESQAGNVNYPATSARKKRKVQLTPDEFRILLSQLLHLEQHRREPYTSFIDNSRESRELTNSNLQNILGQLNSLGYHFEATPDQEHIFLTLPEGVSDVTIKPKKVTTRRSATFKPLPPTQQGCQSLKEIFFSDDSEELTPKNARKMWNDILTSSAHCLKTVISTVVAEIEKSDSSEEHKNKKPKRHSLSKEKDNKDDNLFATVRQRRDSKDVPRKGVDKIKDHSQPGRGQAPALRAQKHLLSLKGSNIMSPEGAPASQRNIQSHREKARQILVKDGDAKNNGFDVVDPAFYHA